MARSRALTILAALLAAGAVQASTVQASAQDPAPAKRKAQYLGGFHPDFCRYPSEQRRNRISACCIMDLDISPEGHVLAADGVCTDPVFLAPTQRCLSVQRFAPATADGKAVRAHQSFEYEWRAEGPAPQSLCAPLRTS